MARYKTGFAKKGVCRMPEATRTYRIDRTEGEPAPVAHGADSYNAFLMESLRSFFAQHFDRKARRRDGESEARAEINGDSASP